MFGQPRSKANTRAYDENYDKIDWRQRRASPKSRGVRVLTDGGYDCGIKSHDHSTFAQAAACVTGKGK